MVHKADATVDKQQDTQGQDASKMLEELAAVRERAKSLEAKLEQTKEANTAGAPSNGLELLRQDSMMAHLLDSLDAGKDIGHYGRLVFAMVARHFLSDEEVVAWLRKDSDFSEEAANAMMRQVEGRDYNPPRRERILAWQREQEFPILPHPDDPDCGNVYRNLKFPDHIYKNIENYQEEKAEATT